MVRSYGWEYFGWLVKKSMLVSRNAHKKIGRIGSQALLQFTESRLIRQVEITDQSFASRENSLQFKKFKTSIIEAKQKLKFKKKLQKRINPIINQKFDLILFK